MKFLKKIFLWFSRSFYWLYPNPWVRLPVPQRPRYKTNEEAFKADAEALRGDWEKVSQDMWKVLNQQKDNKNE